jgi:hypothetical protein
VCCNGNLQHRNHAEKGNYHRIDILYVDLDIETIIDVSCTDYEETFSDEIKSISIQDSNIINNLKRAINNLSVINDDVYPYVDTRIKLLMYEDSCTEYVCISKFTVFIDDKIYLFSDELKDTIKKIINKEESK